MPDGRVVGQQPRPEGDDVEGLAAYVSARTGLSFGGTRRPQLLASLAAAVTRAEVASTGDYERLLTEDEAVFHELAQTLSVGETYFFREPAQLELLRREILPDVRRRCPPDHIVRIWSAGCSTGEEAYTLAILLEEEGLAYRSSVVATDLSPSALEFAKSAAYKPWSFRGVSAEQRRAYFEPVPGGLAVHPRFLERVTFRQMNLLHPHAGAPRGVDVILCRNVLIYFTPEAVERAATLLAGSLAPDGWLLTGSSDPPLHVDGLRTVATPLGFAYRRADASVGGGGEKREQGSSRAAKGNATRRRVGPAKRAVVEQATRHREAERAEPGEAADAALDALSQSDYGRAAELAAAAIAARPDASSAAHVVRVRALANSGRIVDALDAAARAIALFPLDAELRYLHAVALLEADRPAEAVAAAAGAVYLQPDLAVAHLALGRAHRRTGDLVAAQRSFRNARKLLESLPDDADVPLGEGETAARLAGVADLSLDVVSTERAHASRRAPR